MTIATLALRACSTAFLIASLTGCATHVANLPEALNPKVSAGQVALPEGAVISIQFPMLATDAAKMMLQDNYVCGYNNYNGHIMGSCGHPSFTEEFAPLLFEQSTYYSAELKAILARYLPADRIRLEPMRVESKGGQFVSMPLLADTSPSVMVIELYDFPDSVMDAIGSGYMPTVNIRTAGSLNLPACGNLLVSAPHHKFVPAAVDCTKADARQSPGFAPLNYFAGNKIELTDYPKQKQALLADGQVLALTSLWEKNKIDYLKAGIQDDAVFSADRIDNATSDWIARTATALLGRLDLDKAFQASFVHYVSGYDTALAQRMNADSLLPADQQNIALLHKILRTENEWLAAENSAIADGILAGKYGQSFRRSRVLLANKYEKSQALGWLNVGAVLLSGFSSGLFGGAGGFDPSSLTQQTIANERYFSERQAVLGQALLTELSPGVQMRDKVLEVSIDGLNEKISGDTQQEIQAQLKAIYLKLAKT